MSLLIFPIKQMSPGKSALIFRARSVLPISEIVSASALIQCLV